MALLPLSLRGCHTQWGPPAEHLPPHQLLLGKLHPQHVLEPAGSPLPLDAATVASECM